MILHRHLKVLLQRLGLDASHPPDEDRWLALLVLLNDRFRQFEEERHRLQRSLDIHTREVQALYKELTQERDKVSSALSCLDSALIMLDAQGRPLLVSAETEIRLGWSEAELDNKDVPALLGLDAHLPEGGLASLMQGLRAVTLEVPLQTRNGPRLTLVTLQPLVRERSVLGCLLLLDDPEPVVAPQLHIEEPEEEEQAWAPEATVEDVPATPPPSAEGSLRVLLVEANPVDAESTANTLSAMGHDVMLVSDTESAAQAYADETYDAVLCCERPGSGSPLELCRTLRQDARGSYPYFILLVNNPDPATSARALEAGVDALLARPVGAHDLAIRLKVARGVQSRLARVYSSLQPGA